MKAKFWTKIALCCAGYGMVSNSIVTPAITAIQASFQGMASSMTKFILSGPNLISIPAALLTAILTRYISKRKLLILSLGVFCIGGIGGAVAWNPFSMAVTRALDGASDGINTVVACALIAEVFKDDEKTQSQVYGWMNGLTSVLGIITSFVAGVLATINWRFGFLLNCFGLISLVLAVLFVPETPVESIGVSNRTEGRSELKKYIFRLIVNLLVFAVLVMVFEQLVFLVDIIVSELELGTSVLSGAYSSLICIAMSLSYIVFGTIYMKVKYLMPIFMLMLSGIGMVIMSYSSNVVAFGILIAVVAFAAMTSVAYYPAIIARIVPLSQVSFWMSIYTVIMYSVSYLSVYLPNIFMNMFGTATISGTFLYSGGLLIAVGILHIIFNNQIKPMTQT